MDGVIRYAMKGNSIVSIDEAGIGRSSRLVCPACRLPLVAKKGYGFDHFSHVGGMDCRFGFNAMYIFLVASVLRSTRRIFVPSCSCYEGRSVGLDDVDVSYSIDSHLPIICIRSGSRRMLISVKSDLQSIPGRDDAIKRSGISALEMDLTFRSSLSEDAIRDLIENPSIHKRWIVNVRALKKQCSQLKAKGI